MLPERSHKSHKMCPKVHHGWGSVPQDTCKGEWETLVTWLYEYVPGVIAVQSNKDSRVCKVKSDHSAILTARLTRGSIGLGYVSEQLRLTGEARFTDCQNHNMR